MPKPRKDEINWDAVDAVAQGVMPEWGVLLRDHVFKEIPALTFHADRQDDEAELAWHELYGTWWRFLVANHAVHPPAEADQADTELVSMLADFAPLGDEFGRWSGRASDGAPFADDRLRFARGHASHSRRLPLYRSA